MKKATNFSNSLNISLFLHSGLRFFAQKQVIFADRRAFFLILLQKNDIVENKHTYRLGEI